LDVIFQTDISRLQYNKLLLTQANYEFDIYKFGYEKINIKDETQKETLLFLYSNLQERIKAHSVTAHAVYDASMDDIDHRCRVFIKKNSKAIRKLESENKKRTVVINKTVQRLLKNRNHSIKRKQKRLFKEFNDHIKKEERVLRNKLRLLT